MRILAVGGGTAGHVLPAVAVIEILLADGHQVCFVGSRSGLEQRLLANLDVDFYGISAGKLRRYWSWRNVVDVLRVVAGFVQSLWLLRRLRPAVVFSKGGFVALPMVVAAWCWRIPVLAHESDLTPGLANKLSLPFVKALCLSFAETERYLKPAGVRRVHTGTPLRREILHGDAAAGRRALSKLPKLPKLPEGTDQAGALQQTASQVADSPAEPVPDTAVPDHRPLIVVTGGSLGADVLNHVVRAALPELLADFVVLHVCGVGKMVPSELPGYVQLEYVSEGWGDYLAAADFVVSRAGANALFELLAIRKPNVLVPLSAKASRGDQLHNASFAEQQGMSVVIQEEQLDEASLCRALKLLREDLPAYRNALASFTVPAADVAIAAEIERLASANQR